MHPTGIHFATLLLVACSAALPAPASNREADIANEFDSYANVPLLNDSDEILQESPLALELVPPAMVASAAPHVYYMGSDGIAVPAEDESYTRVQRKREVSPETLLADQTVIIGPPSGRPFGVAPIQLGYRPARAYYARRYHKYPWNYH